jgi:hypothetical protein
MPFTWERRAPVKSFALPAACCKGQGRLSEFNHWQFGGVGGLSKGVPPQTRLAPKTLFLITLIDFLKPALGVFFCFQIPQLYLRLLGFGCF